MSLTCLDSRSELGSDIDRNVREKPKRYQESSGLEGSWVEMRHVRVVFGKLGSFVRLSAPDLGVVAEGDSFEKAWGSFIGVILQRSDSAWLTFDVGPTRSEEVTEGLNRL
jgi:hypothetical protein